MIAIKIDIDTHDGMKHGVPRLLDCLARHGAKATFFLSLGPDRSGRAILQMRKPAFARKMLTTGAPSLYGWRTILSGTLLPARPIATAFPALVRRIEDEGHEAAVHAWDHRSWQDDLPRFKRARIRAHFRRSVDAYRELTGHDPAGIGAPSWMTTPQSLALQDDFPFAYASDLRASPACRLRTVDGVRRLPQFPGTGPCLEELLAQGTDDEAALAEALLAGMRRERTALTVLTLHAEVEGGPYLGVLERLLPRLGEFGELATMAAAAPRLAPALPLREWCRVQLPGRAFPVTSSRALAPAAAAPEGR
jgi:peptidoglycan/xylan/chitin deacetylase (PgdA/CDA1 family)